MDNNILYMFNKKKITGLYIGDNTVEFALLKRTVKGPELIKCGQTYIYPEGASEKDMEEETKDDHIIEAIKRLFKENNLRPLNVVFGLPDKEALVRYFQIPKIPKKEWKAAINFEAARYIP
ncbi:MAG: hypothetical protein HQ532_02680, partial [Candidatus Omnitrophica bacterium]|nr:hypothetical protein [Candidatus Omnitrophota bacterium]